MYKEKNIIKAVFRFGCISVVLMFFIGMFNVIHDDNEGKKNMSSGYVTDKEIVYQRATYFRGSDTEYILYFEGEYTNAFDKQSSYTKKIYVDEETYRYYDVGDFFDSKNITETDEKEPLI